MRISRLDGLLGWVDTGQAVDQSSLASGQLPLASETCFMSCMNRNVSKTVTTDNVMIMFKIPDNKNFM